MSKNKTHYFDDVYDVVRAIPKGRVTTYGTISNFLCLGSARMSGWALNKCHNALPPVPAHRVVNRKGELSGRMQFGHPDTMQILLEAEGIKVENFKVVDFDALFWHPEESVGAE
jgi:methylated-DNA-protein-cysteine methyltransferase-like protein